MAGESKRDYPAAIGYHYGPKPNPEVAEILLRGNLFSLMKGAGLNAALRAVVLRAAGHYGWHVIGIRNGTAGLLARPVEADILQLEPGLFDGTLLRRGGTILGTTNKGDPFDYPLPDGRRVDRSEEVIEGYRRLKLDALIGIGGDGSQAILRRLAQQGGIDLVTIPKTIDNDLGHTEVSLGYATAVKVATEALDQLQPTAASHSRVMVLEVMGRDAGHIAIAAGIAGGADAILIPELPYSIAGLGRFRCNIYQQRGTMGLVLRVIPRRVASIDELLMIATFPKPAAALEVPRIGDSFRVDAERIVALQPDVILAWGGGTPQNTVERLRALELPVVVLAPSDLASIPRHLEWLGELTGNTVQAQDVARKFREQLDEIRKTHDEASPIRVSARARLPAARAPRKRRFSPPSGLISMAAAMMTRPSPTTDSREARKSAPARAPNPVAAMSAPRVWGPPPSTSVAMTGSSTLNGTAMRLTEATSASTARMGGKPQA